MKILIILVTVLFSVSGMGNPTFLLMNASKNAEKDKEIDSTSKYESQTCIKPFPCKIGKMNSTCTKTGYRRRLNTIKTYEDKNKKTYKKTTNGVWGSCSI